MSGQMLYQSPMGPLSIYSEGDAITEILFSDSVTENVSAEVIENCIGQLEEYFDGKRIEFDIKLAPAGTEFQKRVWEVLLEIPFGTYTSYLDLALKLGDKKKIRAVGRANGQNPIPIIIPCHRVIGSDGKLVGYAGGLDKKEWLLRHEKCDLYNQAELFR